MHHKMHASDTASTWRVQLKSGRLTKGARLGRPGLEPGDSQESHAAAGDDEEAFLQRHARHSHLQAQLLELGKHNMYTADTGEGQPVMVDSKGKPVAVTCQAKLLQALHPCSRVQKPGSPAAGRKGLQQKLINTGQVHVYRRS